MCLLAAHKTNPIFYHKPTPVPTLKIHIQAEQSSQQAQNLLANSQLQGKIIPASSGKRGVDIGVVIEIVNFVAENSETISNIVDAVSGVTSTAYTLWEWRQKMKEDDKTVLTKEDEAGKEKRMLLEKETSVEEIDQFLNA